jgi:hypothetical protein
VQTDPKGVLPCLGFASDRLRGTFDVCLLACRTNGLALACASGALRKQPALCREACEEDGLALQYCGGFSQFRGSGLPGRRVAWTATTGGPPPKERGDEQLARIAVRQDPRALAFVEERVVPSLLVWAHAFHPQAALPSAAQGVVSPAQEQDALVVRMCPMLLPDNVRPHNVGTRAKNRKGTIAAVQKRGILRDRDRRVDSAARQLCRLIRIYLTG